MRVLVISPGTALEEALTAALPPREFRVVGIRPGGGVVAAARALRPDVAVIDEAGSRREAALFEIAFLRDVCPEVRVIAVSAAPSVEDGALVEAGLYYYCAGAPERVPELVRAAARAAVSVRSGRARAAVPGRRHRR